MAADVAGIDLVRMRLERPIDWEVFEQMAVEVLAQDDLPSLRKLGGHDDHGADGIQQAFYGNEVRTDCVVQVTSQKTQVEKFAATVKRLREGGVVFTQLVIVFRQPLESSVRREIQDKARALGIAVDPRDGEYLVRHLGKPNAIFARYFGTLRQQVNELLDAADPLAVAPDRVHRAMLASLGAYVANPHARLARRTLFEKAALAALVAAGDQGLTQPTLREKLEALFPGETIDTHRVATAVTELKAQGVVDLVGGHVRPSQDTLTSVREVLAQSQAGFHALVRHVIDRVAEKLNLDDATRGYLERNIGKALLHLLRCQGPLTEEGALSGDYDRQGILECLSRSVNEEVARRAALALHEYAVNPRNAKSLAPLVRSYAALAIRNIDPVGRRWQKSALGRSEFALDTDAVLVASVEDLPESTLLRAALAALAGEGVKIIVPESVLVEAIGHIERAPKTMYRFQGRLHRMAPDSVDETVWHAVVRGYYYAGRDSKQRISWDEYYSRYYDKNNARRYFEYLLRRRLKTHVVEEVAVGDVDLVDAEAIVRDLKGVEENRLKAQFREVDDLESRLMKDVRMAIGMARRKVSGNWDTGSGYLLSEDRAFRKYERHTSWKTRPRVHVFRSALPQLAGMVCGKGIDDAALVRLVFNPVAVTAAHLMKDEIDVLGRAGVDLSHISVDRLEWELRESLQEVVHAASTTGDSDDDELLGLIRVAEAAAAKGFPVEPKVREIIERYDDVVAALEEERQRREDAEDRRQEAEEQRAAADANAKAQMAKIAKAAVGQTKKGRSRVRRALSRLGIDLDEVLGTESAGMEPPEAPVSKGEGDV